VLRGGSWNNHAQNVRSVNRNNNTPDNRNHNIGFRLASAQTPAVAAVDQMTIQPVMCLQGGEKPMPPGMLVGSAGRLPEGLLLCAALGAVDCRNCRVTDRAGYFERAHHAGFFARISTSPYQVCSELNAVSFVD
jgi:hypothetical protein